MHLTCELHALCLPVSIVSDLLSLLAQFSYYPNVECTACEKCGKYQSWAMDPRDILDSKLSAVRNAKNTLINSVAVKQTKGTGGTTSSNPLFLILGDCNTPTLQGGNSSHLSDHSQTQILSTENEMNLNCVRQDHQETGNSPTGRLLNTQPAASTLLPRYTAVHHLTKHQRVN